MRVKPALACESRKGRAGSNIYNVQKTLKKSDLFILML